MRTLAFAFASLLATSANAIPIIYSFTGELTYLDAWITHRETGITRHTDPTAPLVVDGVAILNGSTTMTGTITLDHEILGNSTWPPPTFGGQVLGWQLAVGGAYFHAGRSGHPHTQAIVYTPGRAHMWDELPMGQYVSGDVGYLTFNFDPSAFADSLPAPLPVESFLDGTFSLSGFQGAIDDALPERVMGALSGTITSLTRITEVPEPATAWLLSAGLLGLAMSRRRRR